MIFSATDMETMLRVRAAFDSSGLMNPGKIIPVLRGCGEGRAVATTHEAKTEVCAPQLTQAKVYATHAAENFAAGAREEFDLEYARQALSSIVGERDVSPHPPSLTIFPCTIEQVCEVMQLSFSEGWTVTPVGAQTSLSREAPKTNLVLNTRRLNRIIE